MTKRTAILLAFVLAKFALQYLLIGSDYELHRDEFLHLDQGNHPAWGFLSVPPATSVISVIIQLLGNSVFWIKFFPALFGALTIVAVWKITETLNGNLFALVLGATCVLFSVLLRINILYQPNSLDILCWTSVYGALIKYAVTTKAKWLYIAALVFAIGLLNKYNIGFLLIGLVPALLVTPQRKIFLKREAYFGALIVLVLFLPNLVWQYNNRFPVIHHLKELADTQLVHVSRADFLKAQLLFFLGSLVVIIASFFALLRYKPFTPFRFFFWTYLFTILVFLFFKAKDYYAIGLYPVYIAFGSVYLSAVLQNGWKKYLRIALVAIPLLLFVPFLKVGFPNKSPEYINRHAEDYKKLGLLRWEDGKDHELPQDFADMLGWKELAAVVDSTISRLPNPENTLVLCDNYGQAGAINYYSKTKKINAVSFNADYINWFRLDKKILHLVRVKEASDSGKELQETSPYFEQSSVAGHITNPLAREYNTTIFVFSVPKIDVNQRIREELEKKKDNW